MPHSQSPSTPPAPSALQQAQQLAWLHQQPAPATTRQALARLHETIRQCLELFDAQQLVGAQSLLEDSLLHSLVAMKRLNLDPDLALERALARLQAGATRKAFHIFGNRVEIRVGQDVRGSWPLYAEADYEAALQLARELGCDVVHEEASQLGLFAPPPHPDAGAQDAPRRSVIQPDSAE